MIVSHRVYAKLFYFLVVPSRAGEQLNECNSSSSSVCTHSLQCYCACVVPISSAGPTEWTLPYYMLHGRQHPLWGVTWDNSCGWGATCDSPQLFSRRLSQVTPYSYCLRWIPTVVPPQKKCALSLSWPNQVRFSQNFQHTFFTLKNFFWPKKNWPKKTKKKRKLF